MPTLTSLKPNSTYHRRRNHRFQFHSLSTTYLFLLIVFLFLSRLILISISSPHLAVTVESNSQANLAIFIQLSEQTILHLPRLLQALHHPENVYALHFDSNIAPYKQNLARTLLTSNQLYKNVFIIPSEHISYAGVSMLVNTLNAIEYLLTASQNWHFFINLSGADYPLISPHTLRTLLAMPPILSSRLNFIQSQLSTHNASWFYNRRINALHIDTSFFVPFGPGRSNRSLLVNLRQAHPTALQFHIPVIKSEAWVILHRSFAQYSVHSAPARRLLLALANSRASDELFFATLLNHSHTFRQTIATYPFRYIMWYIQGKSLSRPAFIDDFAEQATLAIARSGALFARKFRQPESPLLHYIDTKISGMTHYHSMLDEKSVNTHIDHAKRRLLCAAKLGHITSPCKTDNWLHESR